MLVVRIELWPLGFESGKKHLGTAVIGNDGTSGTKSKGNYTVYLGRRNQENPTQVIRKPLRTFRVEDYPRLRLSVWYLLGRALRQLENK